MKKSREQNLIQINEHSNSETEMIIMTETHTHTHHTHTQIMLKRMDKKTNFFLLNELPNLAVSAQSIAPD